MIKLALIAAEFLPNWGGAGTYNVRLVKHLMNDVEIHVITPRRKINGSSVAYSEEELMSKFDGKVHFHLISCADDTFLCNAKFQWAVSREMPKLNNQYKFDLIHTDHPHMSDILHKPQVPLVTTVHTTIGGHLKGIKQSHISFWNLESSERYQIILNIPLHLVESYYLRRQKHIITVSQWMRRELLNRYPQKDINVVYSGVEPEIFVPLKDQSQIILPEINVPVVLISSRMTAAKGAYYLIKAIPIILKENPEVHFAFAGSEFEQPWKALLQSNGVPENKYTFLGYLPYEQLPSLYARAAIYVCPSLCENLPARVLEAMSCEIPVVSTQIYGIPEAIIQGHNGILVPPQNELALSEAVLRLLNDQVLRQKLGQKARQTVLEKFSWNKLALQIKGMYERVCREDESIIG